MAKPFHLPIVLKKTQLVENRPLLKKYITSQSLYREDVIYESSSGDFLRGEFHKVTIVNRYKLLTNSKAKLVTVAKCETHDGYVIEKTSECITNIIGQANYDLLFSTLCSVISQELKIRGILSLLTVSKKTNETHSQTVEDSVGIKSDVEILKADIAIQTEENILDFFKKKTPRKRAKRQSLSPYVVKDTSVYDKKVKRVVIDPRDFKETLTLPSSDSDELKVDESKCTGIDLPVIEGKIFDENSRESNISFHSLEMPSLLDNVDRRTAHTSQYPIHMLDNTVIHVPIKPEKPYLVASKENLKGLSMSERKKLLFHQAYLDYKCCLDKDEDGNRPLHIAVLNNDLELLRRQCLVLKLRKESVDIGENMTALQMSISLDHPHCTAMLLQHGANPLLTNDEHKTALHLSAETSPEHLRAVVTCCRLHARKFLFDDKDLWEPRFENSSDEELGNYLLNHMCSMYDIQGYTPLMLASKLGKAENVNLLLKSAPSSVNIKTPNSGSTALYLVVEAACIDATERGNKSKVSENFSKTIELLVENGADPAIDNHSGSNINILLTEFSIGELSTLIANKLTSVNVGEIQGNFDSYMLIKSEDGKVKKELIKTKTVKSKPAKKPVTFKDVVLSPKGKRNVKTATDNGKPVILENVRICSNQIEIEVFGPHMGQTDKNKVIENFTSPNVSSIKMKLEPSSPKKDDVYKHLYKNTQKDEPYRVNLLHYTHMKTPESRDKIKIIKQEVSYPNDSLKMDGPSKRKNRATPTSDSKKQKISIIK